jgi:hypothetical protein
MSCAVGSSDASEASEPLPRANLLYKGEQKSVPLDPSGSEGSELDDSLLSAPIALITRSNANALGTDANGMPYSHSHGSPEYAALAASPVYRNPLEDLYPPGHVFERGNGHIFTVSERGNGPIFSVDSLGQPLKRIGSFVPPMRQVQRGVFPPPEEPSDEAVEFLKELREKYLVMVNEIDNKIDEIAKKRQRLT